MLAVIAAAIFVIAFILRLAGAATDAAVAPGSLLLRGWPAWPWTRPGSDPAGRGRSAVGTADRHAD